MKKKWFWIGIVIVLALFLIGFLYSKGIIKTNWQWLTIILAAIAAPIQFISNWLSGKNVRVDKILKNQSSRIQQEQTHRIAYDQAITQREQKIKDLEAQVNVLEDKVDSLELQKKEAVTNVNQMTDINNLQDAFMEAYGDEK